MQGPELIARTLSSIGMVHRVDTVNRELTVFVEGELLAFDVPVGCPVYLHGEPVKLRMVQSQDRVKITHTDRNGLRVARTIEIPPVEISGRGNLDLSRVDQPAG